MFTLALLVLAAAAPMQLFVDASQAPQKMYHCHLSLPVESGPVTLVYPKWIPGQHGPVGPITDVVNLRLSSSGKAVEWQRDTTDFYQIHATVPSGSQKLEADFDVVDSPSTAGEAGPTQTSHLLILPWGTFLMYPHGVPAAQISVDASIRLPRGWKYATALTAQNESNGVVSFQTVDLETLVDSPLDAGAYFKRVVLSSDPPMELDLFADSAPALHVRPELLAAYHRLIAQAPAMYASRHYRTYHFLLALTDRISPDGIEHSASSDNRAPERYLTDAETFLGSIPDLLAHEFSHSWNGKYWRPADLATPDFQAPMKTDLLWVYEGLNQYLGEVLATRSGLLTPAQERDELAMTAAQLSTESGRAWRPLGDVATELPLLYVASSQWGDQRRTSDDVYAEGKMIWADVDATIRRESHGACSLDSFLREWAKDDPNGPRLVTYNRSNVIALLNRVLPYDWTSYFHERIDRVHVRTPLEALEHDGWRLTYSAEPSPMWMAHEKASDTADFRYSVGVTVETDGAKNGDIDDVAGGSPAAKAGIAPGMRISGVNGWWFSADRLREAIDEARKTHAPLRFLIGSDGSYRTVDVPIFTGNRYPHLTRIEGVPDLLSRALEPLPIR